MSELITLSFPADTRNIALARTLAAAMSARADLPLDQLEDVRLAVDEAVSQLILDSPADGEVHCEFDVHAGRLTVAVSARSLSRALPPRDTFGWMVLSALVDDVETSLDDDVVRLVLRVARHAPVGT